MESASFTGEIETPASATPAVETPAPASVQSDAPVTTTAAAVEAGDVTAFRKARHQERVAASEGKPLPTVEKPAPKAEIKPKKGIDARSDQLDAEINQKKAALQEKLRVRAEVDRQLRALDAPVKPKPAEKPEATTTVAQRAEWLNDPNAPKVEQFPDYESYLDARAEFIADKKLEMRLSERDAQSQQQREFHGRVEGVSKIAQTFKERVETFQKSNPQAQFDPQLIAIEPLSAIELRNASVPPDQREPIGPHHFIVEQILRSEHPGPLLEHFSKSPDEFHRLYSLGFEADGARRIVASIGALEARLGSASPAPSPSARVSTVPNPPTTLSGRTAVLDPVKTAVQNGDVRAFRRLRHQERVAAMGR